jgi:hypothetical protein
MEFKFLNEKENQASFGIEKSEEQKEAAKEFLEKFEFKYKNGGVEKSYIGEGFKVTGLTVFIEFENENKEVFFYLTKSHQEG